VSALVGIASFAAPPGSTEILAVLLAYLLGSVPFGLVLGYLVGRVDIRTIGSGNIGATNVGRALGRPWAVVAFVGDFGKGWISTFLLAPWLASAPENASLLAVVCGGAAVGGHCWPVYLRFRGGKGVATGCGALVGIDPLLFVLGGAVWLVTLGLFRFVSLSSMAMGLSFPLIALWRTSRAGYGSEVVLGAAALSILVFVRHRANMARILAGTEPRVGRRPRTGDASEPREREEEQEATR